MTAEEITAWGKLLETVVSARWYILIIIIAAAMIAAGVVLYYLRMRAKERKDLAVLEERRVKLEQEGKDRRAKAHAGALGELVGAVRDMRETSERNNRETVATIDRFVEVGSKTQRAVELLARKLDGKMGREDSARFIHSNFERDFFRDTCTLIERSLRENDYERRKDYVRNKIKTLMGDHLRENRDYLASFPVSIDVREYFRIHTDQEGERFTLCDEIWTAVEPKYAHGQKVEHRIEEACLAIENTIRDYLAQVYSSLGYGRKPGLSNPSFKTPLPGSIHTMGSDSEPSLAALSALPGASVPGAQTAALLRRRS